VIMSPPDQEPAKAYAKIMFAVLRPWLPLDRMEWE
jgi:hypothetical protein